MRNVLLLAAVGLSIFPFNEMIARGIMGLFLGGVTFCLTDAIKERADAKTMTKLIGALAFLGWAFAISEFYVGTIGNFLRDVLSHVSPSVAQFCGEGGGNLFLFAFIFVVSPLTIMALFLHEQVFKVAPGRPSFLGDISYSVYMLHFPMQLSIAFAALKLGFRVRYSSLARPCCFSMRRSSGSVRYPLGTSSGQRRILCATGWAQDARADFDKFTPQS